jgi:hypothetical protein
MAKSAQLCLPFLQVKKDLLLDREKGAKMATAYSIGHGMRRRNGTPSNPLEAAGTMKNRNHPTHHEAYDAASQMGSPRIPMGDSTMNSVDEINPAQLQGTLMPKKNTQAADPTAGGKANRVNVPYQERMGGQYRITVPFTPTIDPAAGPTMANARIVPSIAGRANPNFSAGIEASSL